MSKTIILTGASRGIGHATALSLLTTSPSTNLVLLARTAAPLAALQTQYPDRVRFLAGSLASPATYTPLISSAIALALEAFGRVDGLILNHGSLGPVVRITDSDVAGWAEAFHVNFLSCVEFVKQALPHLRETHGVILLTSSGASTRAYPAWACYGATKAALNHFAVSIAAEESLVTVLAVRPGVVDTEMQTELREKHTAKMDEADRAKFWGLKREGKLVDAGVVGGVFGRVVLGAAAKKGLSGRFLSWDDGELAAFRTS